MKLTGWGKYPTLESKTINPYCIKDVLKVISSKSSSTLVARGLGRSYGDSALAPSVINTTYLNHLIQFNQNSGLLKCYAGISLAGILDVFVPKGWFLPVTPGTKFVTIGGAIASDVHGKNHHLEGSLTEHVTSIKIATVAEGVIECSQELHPELFRATCGGMGLTGVILEATLKLKPIHSSYINKTIIKARNLEEALELFEEYQDRTYSVAWIDCLSMGKSLGRSLLMLGEHANEGNFIPGKSSKVTIPVEMPSLLLNRYSIQAFNTLYYHRVTKNYSDQVVHLESFFYPLDGIHQWNRLYGKNGFLQYQFVLPKEAGVNGIMSILKSIAKSRRGSFLAVLKIFGKGNKNYLSFPMEGYTLALDFKLERGLFEQLDELDKIVLNYGGRLYLTKDARMSEDMFKESYPQWERFMETRTRYGADQIFNSLQSQRLGL